MNVPELLKFLIVIEEEGHKKLSEGATPVEVAEWRVRAFRKLHSRATDPAQDLEPTKAVEAAEDENRPKLIGNDPRAGTMKSLVLPVQLANLRALARSKGLDPDEVCEWAYHCKTEDLDQVHANILADYFRGYVPPKAERLRAV